METLQLLGVGLGLATLAGINLYLTVFVSGLAIHFHWIALSPAYHRLEVLGDPLVLGIAGVLCFIEFFADKIPWLDSLWDSVHTVIRPLGGALLAVSAFGSTNPTYDVIIALLAGSMSFATHTAKAGGRLVANGSPEPFSNIALSVLGDAAVVGGLFVIHWNPLVALGLAIAIFLFLIWVLPIILRTIRVKVWLAWRKLQQPAQYPESHALPDHLPHDYDILLHQIRPGEFTIDWAVKVISGRGKNLPSNRDGWLVGLKEEPHIVYFLAKKFLGVTTLVIDLEDCKVSHEPRFLQDDLVIYHPEKKWRRLFVFDRPRNPIAQAVASTLTRNMNKGAILTEELEYSAPLREDTFLQKDEGTV
ncbi:MAG: DUF4126 domain-containing protein [Chthoniobacterales bacterium]